VALGDQDREGLKQQVLFGTDLPMALTIAPRAV